LSDTSPAVRKRFHRLAWPAGLGAVFLAIEFLDEVSFGLLGAAWPAIRDDLRLNYAQIGFLAGLPVIFGNAIEPLLGLLGDLGRRKRIIVAGGLCFALASLLTGVSASFAFLLLALVFFYPSSGAFVSLSQATLMDLDPARRELGMARWTLAGAFGVMAGPLLLSLVLALGGSWRLPLAGLAAGALLLTAAVWVRRFPEKAADAPGVSFRGLLRGLGSALRRVEVLRWLALLAIGDLMLDVLLGFLALYGTDVVGVSPAAAGLMVAVWTGVGLIGDALLIPLLKRVDPLKYLRLSAAVTGVLFPAFLLLPWFAAKLTLLALMGLWNAGWYAIPQAHLYAALPGRSGTAMAVTSAFGMLAGGIPLALGALALRYGLSATMWLLLAGPAGLLLLLPRGAPPAPAEISGNGDGK
jgi:FSR family fosmidomycin resistance protein-like MFS transporter